MKGFLVCQLLCLAVLAYAQPRPVTVCFSGSSSLVTEGVYFDFVSSAPDGFRTSVHTFGYVPQDSATYSSQYYFKSGTSVGWEAIRWPWILHYTETVSNTELEQHTFQPIPLVIGEQPIGYLMVPDLDHDMEMFTSTSTASDGVLSVVPGELVINPPLFAESGIFSAGAVAQACFTYTLDQFGGLARVAGGYRLQGYGGPEVLLSSAGDGVYALISHRALAVSGRMCSTRSASSTLCEAGITLADGHRFVLDARGAQGAPTLEMHLPTGGDAQLVLDEALESTTEALPLHLDAGEESEAVGVRSQLFVRAFSNNEEALQDPAIANYLTLGDLDHLDFETTRITARVLMTTWAFEVTLVSVEEHGEASLVLLSHRRVFASATDADVTTQTPTGNVRGILAATTNTKHFDISLDAFKVQGDSVLETTFTGSLFKLRQGHL